MREIRSLRLVALLWLLPVLAFAAPSNQVVLSQLGAVYNQNAAELSLGVCNSGCNYAYPPADVRRYGALGLGPPGNNDTPGIQTAINVAQVMGVAVQLVPGGKHYLATGLVFKQGRNSTDTQSYLAQMEGNQSTLSPAAGITAITIVPRCLLSDAGTGRGVALIDFRNFVIDGGVAAGSGANAVLLGAAGFKTDAFAESGFTNVTVQNFTAQTTTNGGFLIVEARHLSFKRFIIRLGVTMQINAQTSGSFAGDFSFDAGSDLAGTGTTQRPLYLTASGGGQVRGIKFAGDIYGPGTYLLSSGAASQVGDIWFSPGMQFDGIAQDTASFLEIYATSSGQIFNIQSTNDYYEAVNEIQAVYLHLDTGGTTKGIDISGNWVGGMNVSASLGAAPIYVVGASGFNINNNKFDAIIGTGGTNPAYVKITSASSNFEVSNNIGTNPTNITYGVYLDASANNLYSILGNSFGTATTTLSDNSTSSPTEQAWNNLGNITAPSWTTNGIVTSSVPAVLTDTTGTGTISQEAAYALPIYTISATNAGVTITHLYESYLPAPLAGTNVTATNLWSLGMAGGERVGGQITGLGGLFVNGGAITLNGSSNFAVSVGTGTNNQNVNIGGTANKVLIDAPLVSSAGTQFTIASGTGACATTSNKNGGVQVGDFQCTGTTGASTITLTLAASVGGYVCYGRDITTPTTVTQTGAKSTTSVTLTFTSVTANDAISFGCLGY